MNEDNKPKAFIFIGRSGCGKGTQAKLFMDNFKEKRVGETFFHLESGAHFREFIKGGSFSSELSKKIMESGKLQPEFLAVWAWSHLLVENLKVGDNLVLDGTPRKVREAHILETAFDYYGFGEIYVVHLDITKEETKKRLALRGRLDDINSEDVDKRLEWFDKEVAPVIEFYKNDARYNYIHIDAEQSVEKIHEEVVERVWNT